MSNVVSIVSEKGGVGKTTVALNLALALADRGKNTLLVDLDPQGSIGHSLAKGDSELPGVTELLFGALGSEEGIVRTKHPELSLLPRGRLSPIDTPGFEGALNEVGRLERVLDLLKAPYDYVLLDTPSGVGGITRSALRVSDFALIPFQAEPLCLRSVGRTLGVLEHVAKNENTKLRLLGLLPTMVDRDSQASQEVMTTMWTHFEGVLDTVIPRTTVFAEASLEGVPLEYLAGPARPEARRFDVLAAEISNLVEDESLKGDHDRPKRSLL